MKRVDIHTHLLHGVDDGPPTLDAAVELVRVLGASGVCTAAATPHVSEAYRPSPATLAERLDALRAGLEAADIRLDVRSGAEVDVLVVHDLSDEDLRQLTLSGSHWLLLEIPHGRTFPFGLEDALARLSRLGLGVVLGHPERNRHVQADERIVEEAVAGGALAQITAASLEGRFGQDAERLAWRMLQRGTAHVVASDCHDLDGRDPDMGPACELIEKRFDVGTVERLVSSAPAAILADAAPREVPRQGPSAPRRWWRRRRGD